MEKTDFTKYDFKLSDGRQVVIELYHNRNDNVNWYTYYDVTIEGRTVEHERIAQHVREDLGTWNTSDIEADVRKKYDTSVSALA